MTNEDVICAKLTAIVLGKLIYLYYLKQVGGKLQPGGHLRPVELFNLALQEDQSKIICIFCQETFGDFIEYKNTVPPSRLIRLGVKQIDIDNARSVQKAKSNLKEN